MGTIIGSKTLPNQQMILKICIDHSEALALLGTMKRIYVFTDRLSLFPAKIIEKGKDGAAKYLEIPIALRDKNNRVLKNKVSHIIKTEFKLLLLYSCDKKEPAKPIY